MKSHLIKWYAFCVLLSFVSCKKDKNTQEYLGTVDLHYSQLFNGKAIQFDDLIYINEAGNTMMFTEIQYFISEATLIDLSGVEHPILPEIHYVDTDIESSQTQTYPLPTGSYSKIRFTFGLSEALNISYSLPNAPERDMSWPDHLGGGYHYMKLNGKYDVGEELPLPFNFHLGPGQDEQNNIIHNFFTVEFPLTDCTINHASEEIRNTFEIKMEVANWFKSPNIWDINTFGATIMDNQEAMKAACENGEADVFSVEFKKVKIVLKDE